MKILKVIIKWSLLSWVVVGVFLTTLWFLNPPQEFIQNSETQKRLDQGDYSVEIIELDIVDLQRSTPALGKYDGDDKRTLTGKIWFPEGQSTDHPLIVYSHGFGGYHNENRSIAKYLARNGYVVAAVNFPLSTRMSPAGVPQMLDVVNQPGDVSAVIDQLLSLNNDETSDLYDRIDSNNIGVMGLSLGGLTTALVSFFPDFIDERIKTSIMMAPPLEGFNDNFFASNPTLKSLVISGSMDRIIPESVNATEVKTRHPNGWFMSLEKGTHLGFANIGNPMRWMENPDNVGCTLLKFNMSKLDLPERWDAIFPNTKNVLRDMIPNQPCPEITGKAMNGLKQHWITQVAIGTFFDMYLRQGDRAIKAYNFFTSELISENPEVKLTSPTIT